MTVGAFDLLRPESLAEASELLLKYGDEARPIAGGTTLVILMNQRVLRFSYLVDLQGIAGLDQISQENGCITIGAMATLRSVERSAMVRESVPVLVEAFSKVGNIRVRETASVGGNLAHADYRLDPPPAFLILDADVIVYGPNGTRTISIRDFYRGTYETVLEPGEILVAVKVPVMPKGCRAAYLKYRSLAANDWPCLGVAAFLSQAKGVCRELRLGLAGLASTPVLIEGLDSVRGQPLTDPLLEEVAKLAKQQISPMSDLRGSEGYKRQMARVFIKRAIREAERRFSV